ncbi:MAG: YerC/YecD family TrpR-related protein [Candidatus Parcubacteria bacterium]|nr:YerC/YecD family TrpR-related protein [Candidatus Parcubacteria bacterium]
MKNSNNKNLDNLYTAIVSLKSETEAKAFLRDLCTLEELRAMAERWQIVLLLKQGLAYREIASQLKVSTTTVSRVAFWLNNGTGGYNSIFNRTHHSSSVFKKS